jgi:prolyl-tRNA synthetase
MSALFARTLREAPAEAEVASHRLLLRAAYIRKVVAGVYTMLPLGLRTLRKIEAIVREEMEASGAQEIRLPIILPAEPWKVTGRWDVYGELMFKLRDRHQREMGLGPTHEEAVTPLVAGEFSSYRDLPVNLYQIEWKYRDELRPRFGLLRVREFLMKDAYSFDRNEDGMVKSYQVMMDAYRRVFDRCGLTYQMVEADPGQIGGDVNHEFIAVAPVGEDEFVTCENCDYAADAEAASARPPEAPAATGRLETVAEVSTPGRTSVQAVSGFMGLQPSQMLKCILYDAGGRTVAVLIPGDREINESKVARAMWPEPVRLFEDEDFRSRGLLKGFVGPSGLPEDVTVIADVSARGGRNWVTGANRPDTHATGVNVDRDFRVDRWEDVSQVRPGDPCPVCGGRLRVDKGIVLGHTYQLGTRYSKPLKATFVDEDGTEQPYQMGCYGIGITRTVAAAAEQFNDQAGLLWPKVLAPYDAVVICTNMDHDDAVEAAERLYAELSNSGLDVVIDDRDVTAGVKFADADLIGFPIQVVVGKRGLESGMADLKLRATGDRSQAPLPDAAGAAARLLESAP